MYGWNECFAMYGWNECFAHHHRDYVPLERHHVRPLADGGPDEEGNIVELCPNAHRRVHDYIRLLKKNGGQVPWIKRKFFGKRVKYIGQAGYDMIRAREQ